MGRKEEDHARVIRMEAEMASEKFHVKELQIELKSITDDLATLKQSLDGYSGAFKVIIWIAGIGLTSVGLILSTLSTWKRYNP